MMKPQLIRDLAIEALDDLKGIDITKLNVRKMTTVTDWMIFCSGRSTRHVQSLAENVVTKMKQHGIQALSVEGKSTGEWVLIDLADVVVHVMLPQTRDFYQLEQLWSTPEKYKKSQL